MRSERTVSEFFYVGTKPEDFVAELNYDRTNFLSEFVSLFIMLGQPFRTYLFFNYFRTSPLGTYLGLENRTVGKRPRFRLEDVDRPRKLEKNSLDSGQSFLARVFLILQGCELIFSDT